MAVVVKSNLVPVGKATEATVGKFVMVDINPVTMVRMDPVVAQIAATVTVVRRAEMRRKDRRCRGRIKTKVGDSAVVPQDKLKTRQPWYTKTNL